MQKLLNRFSQNSAESTWHMDHRKKNIRFGGNPDAPGLGWLGYGYGYKYINGVNGNVDLFTTTLQATNCVVEKITYGLSAAAFTAITNVVGRSQRDRTAVEWESNGGRFAVES